MSEEEHFVWSAFFVPEDYGYRNQYEFVLWYGEVLERHILMGWKETILFLAMRPSVLNSLTGTGIDLRLFFDELHWRLTISVNIRIPTTYVSDYENSAF